MGEKGYIWGEIVIGQKLNWRLLEKVESEKEKKLAKKVTLQNK